MVEFSPGDQGPCSSSPRATYTQACWLRPRSQGALWHQVPKYMLVSGGSKETIGQDVIASGALKTANSLIYLDVKVWEGIRIDNRYPEKTRSLSEGATSREKLAKF